MKNFQKLIVKIENLQFVSKFADLDTKFHKLVESLERQGSEFGPVIDVIDGLCVTIEYADGKKKPSKPDIFGYKQDDFLRTQYK